jgi:hypothetical protein
MLFMLSFGPRLLLLEEGLGHRVLEQIEGRFSENSFTTRGASSAIPGQHMNLTGHSAIYTCGLNNVVLRIESCVASFLWISREVFSETIAGGFGNPSEFGPSRWRGGRYA